MQTCKDIPIAEQCLRDDQRVERVSLHPQVCAQPRTPAPASTDRRSEMHVLGSPAPWAWSLTPFLFWLHVPTPGGSAVCQSLKHHCHRDHQPAPDRYGHVSLPLCPHSTSAPSLLLSCHQSSAEADKMLVSKLSNEPVPAPPLRGQHSHPHG